MTRILFLMLAVFAIPALHAADAPFSVTALVAQRHDLGPDPVRFRFPLVHGGADGVAARINDWLQASMLDRLVSAQGGTPFERVWPKPGSWQGVVAMDYAVTANTPGYLELQVTGSFVGPYESPIDSRFLFAARSGRPLALADLFSAQGLQRFARRVRDARQARIDRFLASDEARTDGEDAKTQRRAYLECRAQMADADLSYDDLVLERGRLHVIRGHCFPHVIQALDDLWDFDNAYPFAALDADLSAYGHCLLVARRTDCALPAGKVHAGVFRGTLGGRYPITLVWPDDGHPGTSPGYAYDRVGTLIELYQADAADGRLRLQRREGGAVTETFELEPDGDGGLHGRWSAPGKRPLAVQLR